MYAIIETGGKQYRVSPGDEIKTERLPGEPGEQVTFDRVLLTAGQEKVQVGKPYLGNAVVSGRILRQARDRKVMVFKYKRRKGYRRKRGHRQHFTLVRIDQIGSVA